MPWCRLPSVIIFLLMLLPFAQAETQTPPRDPARLQLASVSAAVATLDSGELVYGKRADWVMPIASITKLMTALVVLESGAPLDEWLRVEERHFPAAANAFSRIRPGSEARRGDLLRIALMSSENYAAYLLARHHPEGYDAFIEAMNRKALALGMTQTRFVDSSGLSHENVASAEDLVKLARAAYALPTLRKYSTGGRYSVHFRQPGYTLYYGNTNPLVHSSRWQVDLTKTGYLTEAGRCLLMVTEIDGEPVAMALLNSFGTRTPLGDAGRIRRWLQTGHGGTVAKAAQRYEQDFVQQRQALAQAEGTSDGER